MKTRPGTRPQRSFARRNSFAIRTCGLLAFLSLLLLLSSSFPITTVSASPSSSWGSWFSSDEDEKQKENDVNDSSSQVLVSPIVNREIDVSVKAHAWPSTPQNVLCEAYVYHQQLDDSDNEDSDSSKDDSNLATTFLNRLVALVAKITPMMDNDTIDVLSSYPAMLDLALQASPLTGTARNLLQMSLSLRASTPLCEVHRGLARQTLQQSSNLQVHHETCAVKEAASSSSLQQTAATDEIFAVLHPAGKTLLLNEMAAFDWTTLVLSSEAADSASNATDDSRPRSSSLLLPSESVTTSMGGDLSPFVILYTNFVSSTFVRYYSILTELDIPLVVRFQGAVHYEEDKSTATSTTLQGYGVRLDIRNVEYKVFDDRKDSDTEEAAALINLTSSSTAPPHPPSDFLAGVDWKTIQAQNSEKKEDDIGDENNMPWYHQLWKTHERQQRQSEIIPPIWQRRQLPLQAATVLCATTSDEDDVLQRLIEISHNLPSVASTLVKVPVDDAVQEAATKITEDAKIKAGRFYVNGRVVSFDRPTFNVFEYMNMLREEDMALSKMQKTLSLSSLLSAPAVLRKVQKAWMQGDAFVKQGGGGSSSSKSYRIDVGRGWKQSIVYLNDIEKDVQYAQWTRSVRQMLQQMQFGMPPTVRRNLFTIISVMDPLSEDGADSVGLSMGMQLMQNSYPVRIGVLMVNQEDVNRCSEWLSSLPSDEENNDPCPVKPLFDGKKPTNSDLGQQTATAQAVHRLLAKFADEYGSQPGALVAYMEFFMMSIAEKKSEQDFVSMNDLLEIHAGLLEGTGLMFGPEAQSAARECLLDPEDVTSTEDYLYGKALRFVAEKGLKPGMSFLNGRPLPSGGGGADGGMEEVSRIYGEEQKTIFTMVVKGEITDNAPKSVYAKFLSGNGVFKRAHPLLCGGGGGGGGPSGDSSSSYLDPPHVFGPESLLFAPGAPTSTADAYFVVEYHVDFDTVDGLKKVSQLLSSLDKFPTVLGGDSEDGSEPVQVKTGYRVLPNNEAATLSPLCPILSRASLVGVDALVSMVEKLIASSETGGVESLEKLLEGTIDGSARDQILAAAADGSCTGFDFKQNSEQETSQNVVAGNGRFFETGSNPVSKDDIELLLTLEVDRAKAVAELLKDRLESGSPDEVDAASRVATFLSAELAKSDAPQTRRTDILGHVLELETKMEVERMPLRFSWNEPAEDEPLKVQITAVLDPVADTTQRWAPFLLALRDELELPVNLILAPAPLIDGDSKVPITSFYRFVSNTGTNDVTSAAARFSWLPTHLLTIRMDVPESWDVQQTRAIQDTDNLRCDVISGCSDEAHTGDAEYLATPIMDREHVTRVEYGLNSLLVFGQCYETTGSPPNGLQLELSQNTELGLEQAVPSSQEAVVGMDGTSSVGAAETALAPRSSERHSDTLVMKNVGYWQLRVNPGVWRLSIAEESKGAEIFDFLDGQPKGGRIQATRDNLVSSKLVVMKDYVNRGEMLFVKRRPGQENSELFFDVNTETSKDNEVINVFSLATGHLYERFLKIMMLSVAKRTSSKVKFWLFENFLSPTFKATARAMAARIGCEVEFVTYKWPEWLRGQSEKQRIIWGYKILFLDVLFPLNVKKIIYVDADQVVRADLKELWDMDLEGKAYGYTPFCTSRETTLGYQFWREGFWKNHLRGRPYHISALYVVDLEAFRRQLVGDQLRSIYQQLSADPNSLSNLDQDLPNYAQYQVPIFSLPQEWLWCESWCSDETKETAKTIDLCNNPMHKEPKVSMAKRVIAGPLFNESWVELDAEVERYEQEYLALTS